MRTFYTVKDVVELVGEVTIDASHLSKFPGEAVTVGNHEKTCKDVYAVKEACSRGLSGVGPVRTVARRV